MSRWSQHSTLFNCIFCDKFISSSTFVPEKSYNCSNSLSYDVTHSLNYILKQIVRHKASQIDIFTHKLDNSDSATKLWAFLLILILNQSYHQTHSWRANIHYSWGVAEALSVFASYPFFLSHLSCFFSVVW